MRSAYVVSPLEAITTTANEIGAQVDYSLGAGVNLNLPLATPYLKSKHDGSSEGTLEFWLPPNNPGADWLNDITDLAADTTPDHLSKQKGGFVMLLDGEFAPMAVPDQCNRVSSPDRH